MRSGAWALVISITAALAASSPPPVLSVAGRANATPSIASDGDVVAVAWSASTSEGATDIYAAVSRDGGVSFTAPVRVNDASGDARVSGEQPPRVVVQRAAANTVVAVVWTTKAGAGTVMKQSRSSDGGRTFSSAAIVPGSAAAGNRGWEAIAVGRDNRVDALWLDHRELAREDGAVAATHHQHGGGSSSSAPAEKPDGVAMAQRSKLYFGSLDGSVQAHALTGGVCYCCKTALIARGDAVYAAWRHVYPGNLRDIAFTLSHDGGRTFDDPVRISEDKWAIEGCPDDGPAMAVDGRGRIHVVWPTLVADGASQTVALFYAASADGRQFTPRARVPTEGMAHHPQIAIAADESLAIAWDEATGGRRRVVLAQGQPNASGQLRLARRTIGGDEAGLYPVVARSGDGIVVAWTSSGAESVIRTARIATDRSTR